MKQYKLIIFDCDGTLRRCTIPGQPCPNKDGEWELMPHVRETLIRIRNEFHPHFAICSNQAGIAAGYLTAAQALDLLSATWLAIFPRLEDDSGLIIFCPHASEVHCSCRKPQPGMLLSIMARLQISRLDTLYVGDMDSDYQAAENAEVDFQWAWEFFSWEERSTR